MMGKSVSAHIPPHHFEMTESINSRIRSLQNSGHIKSFPHPPAQALRYISPIPPKQRPFSRQTSVPKQQGDCSAVGSQGMRPLESVPSGQRQSLDVRKAEAHFESSGRRIARRKGIVGRREEEVL